MREPDKYIFKVVIYFRNYKRKWQKKTGLNFPNLYMKDCSWSRYWQHTKSYLQNFSNSSNNPKSKHPCFANSQDTHWLFHLIHILSTSRVIRPWKI